MTGYGVREEDLFDADDLFHASRFDLIVLMLSKLSKHKRLIDAGIKLVYQRFHKKK